MRRSFSAFILLLGGCSGGVPIGVAREAIIGGTDDASDAAVVLLRGHVSDGSFAICSATMISPTVALTAAHCLDPASIGNVTSYDVFLGDDLTTQGNDAALWIDVTKTAFDTAFNPQALELGHDVGVAILASPVSIAPVAINHAPLTAASMGAPLRVVGFGITSAADTTGTTVGVKRVVTTPLTSYDGLFVNFGGNGANTCEGDSGGPALLSVGGASVIAGFTSFGPSNCGGVGSDTRADTIGYAFAELYLPSVAPDMSSIDLARPPNITVAPGAGGGEVEPIHGGCSAGGELGDGRCAIGLAIVFLAWRRRRWRAARG